MDRKTLLLLPLFLLGIALLVEGTWSLFFINEGAVKAARLDRRPVPNVDQGPGSLCVAGATLAQRVLSESDTEALTVLASNRDTANCVESISLIAPEFGVSPNTLDRTLTIPPGQTRSFVWILIPQKLGTFSLAVAFSSSETPQVMGITVTDVYGLKIWQAQLLAGAGTFLGTALGPLLAIVWISWLWRRRTVRGSWTRPRSAKKQRLLPAGGASPLRLVYCAVQEDKALRKQLAKHLSPLLHSGHIIDWDESEITAGTVREDEIMAHLNAANIILLLISPDFVASDDCMNRQMPRALERHRAGEVVVVPIILRHVTWEHLPFADLQVLPSEGRTVYSPDWATEDEAFYEVVQGISQVVGPLLAVKTSSN